MLLIYFKLKKTPNTTNQTLYNLSDILKVLPKALHVSVLDWFTTLLLFLVTCFHSRGD